MMVCNPPSSLFGVGHGGLKRTFAAGKHGHGGVARWDAKFASIGSYLAAAQLALFASLAVGVTPRAHGISLVINEWSAVGVFDILAGSDSYFGRKPGSGDNWVELGVSADHLDIRGWKIEWENADPDEGSIQFSQHAIWSDLRKGTIIVVRENDVDNDAGGGVGPIPSDISYAPFADDWTIFADMGDASLMVDNGWKVDNDGWKTRILDAANNVVQNFVGELGSGAAFETDSGINSSEVGVLRAGVDATLSVLLTGYFDADDSTFLSPNPGQAPSLAALRSMVLAESSGDWDADGDVDGRDFLIWQRGESPNALRFADLTAWRSNFGVMHPGSAQRTAVPEPAWMALVCFWSAVPRYLRRWR